MPQSEVNAPAHLHEIKIKENLNYRVFILKINNSLNQSYNFTTLAVAPFVVRNNHTPSGNSLIFMRVVFSDKT